MTFLNPSFVWLFLLIPIMGFLFSYRSRHDFLNRKKIIDKKMWPSMMPGVSFSRKFWKQILYLIGISILIFCLLRPQYGVKNDTIRKQGQDILIALDTSTSMLSEDIKPSRFERAKQEILELSQWIHSDRLGLISFSGSAFVSCPLTLDYAAFRLFLDDAYVGNVSHPGTNLEATIDEAINSFSQFSSKSQKNLIIVSDGESFDGDTSAAASKAKEAGIKVFTLGIGKPKGDPIPIKNTEGQMVDYKKNKQGELVISTLNDKTLKELAQSTGGRYFQLEESQITDVVQALKGQQNSTLANQKISYKIDRYVYFLWIALGLLWTECLIFRKEIL